MSAGSGMSKCTISGMVGFSQDHVRQRRKGGEVAVSKILIVGG